MTILANLPLNLPDMMCSIEGFVMDASCLSTFVWYLAISIALYQLLYHKEENIEKYYHYWLFLAYIFLPLIQVIPFITNSYGQIDTLCTLKEDFYGNLWRLLCVYLPTWIQIFITTYYYLKLICNSQSMKENSFLDKDIKKYISKSIQFPILLLITTLPISVLRLIETFNDSSDLFILEAISLLLWGLQGLSNAIIYGLNESVRQYICDHYI